MCHASNFRPLLPSRLFLLFLNAMAEPTDEKGSDYSFNELLRERVSMWDFYGDWSWTEWYPDARISWKILRCRRGGERGLRVIKNSDAVQFWLLGNYRIWIPHITRDRLIDIFVEFHSLEFRVCAHVAMFLPQWKRARKSYVIATPRRYVRKSRSSFSATLIDAKILAIVHYFTR